MTVGGTDEALSRAAAPTVDDATRAAEVTQRIEVVRSLLDARGARAVLLGARRNFAWLTLGGSSHVVLADAQGAASVLVTRDQALVLTQDIEEARIREEEMTGVPIEVRGVPWHEEDAIDAEAARICGEQPLEESELEAELTAERSVLGVVEQERMVWLGARVRAAIEGTLGEVEPGTSEDTLGAAAAAGLAAQGVRAPVVLVAADDRIARYRHPLPMGATVQRRVMLVLVAERWGLHVALTGIRDLEPPSDDIQRRSAATAGVMQRMREATRPGATLGDVFAATQAAYAEQGYPEEWRLHHQGGTIAYQGREAIATPGSTSAIEPGMAFAWNPSITGAKAEETFLLRADGSSLVITDA